MRHEIEEMKTTEVFKLEPSIILFSNYLLDVTYEKKFKLRNVSKTTQSFLPSIIPKDSCFKVYLHPESKSRVAPGMCAIYIVQLRSDCYYDKEEFMYFISQTGHKSQVTLKCQRTPPIVTLFVFKDSLHFLEKCRAFETKELCDERLNAVNSTIDCGGCLLGKDCNISLILGNTGGTAQFFIISERNWNDWEVTNVNEQMALSTEHFHIYPDFFEIKQNEMVAVDITFTPSTFGVEVEKFFFVCDNNSVNEFEVVGDGIIFDTNLVTIQVGHTRDVKIDVKNSTSTKYFIDFGDCVYNRKCIRNIIVENNGTADLPYKWKVSDNDYNEKSKLTKELNRDYLNIVGQFSNLPHSSESIFDVTLEVTDDENYGDFSLVYELYVLDVPEIALEENRDFYCIETEEDSVLNSYLDLSVEGEDEGAESSREELVNKLLIESAETYLEEEEEKEEAEEKETLTEELKSIDVMVAKIEIFCTIQPMEIYISPPFFKHHGVYGLNTQISEHVEINANGVLNCKWQKPKHKEITISPMEMTLNPYIAVDCYFHISLDLPKSIRETLHLIGERNIRSEYEIDLKVIRVKVMITPKALNFGTLSTSAPCLKKDIVLLNTSDIELGWRILEFVYDFNLSTMTLVTNNKALSCTEGALEPMQQYCIHYTLQKKKLRNPSRWFSILVLFTTSPRIAVDFCYVTFEVIQPQITIHTNPTSHLILSHDKVMYVGIQEKYSICVFNNGTVTTDFKFDKPIGCELNKLKINICPNRAIIRPNNCKHVVVTVKPLECGFVSKVFLPCFVRGKPDPYHINLLCAIDALNIVFYLPIKDQKNYQKVWWPPRLADEESNIDLDVEQEEEHVKDSSYACDTRNSLASLLDSEKHCNSLVDVIKYTNEGIDDYYEEQSICVETTTDDTFEKTVSNKESSVSLLSAFGSDVILQNYAVQYYNVPLRTPVKRTIMMRNITPLATQFIVEAINFHDTDDKDERTIRELMSDLKIDKIDLWEESIKDHKGIVVKVMPSEGKLDFKKIEIVDIWIYANTWGTYLEEIVVEMSDIAPFCFNLVIDVVGTPLEFPIALNSISEDIFLRFGSIPYLSNPIQRQLKITNSSSIPIGVVWHIFDIPKIVTHCGVVTPKDPFNLLIDIFERPVDQKLEEDSETDIKCTLTPRYYGKEDSSIFEIKPSNIKLNPKSTGTVNIIFHPKAYKVKFKTTAVKAYLRGYIHIDNKFSFQENLFSRTVQNYMTSKVKVTATLELTLLKLELVRGDTRFTAFANDICKAEKIRYEKVLVFKNRDKSPAEIYMHILHPFKIVSLRTAQTCTKEKCLSAKVHPGECVEVIVQCDVNEQDVLKCSRLLYNKDLMCETTVANVQNQSITLSRFMNIHQLGLQKQILKMQLTIFYPVLSVSTDSIDFGIVFLRNTKKMILTLTNPTGSHVPFKIFKQSEALTVVPTEGSVPKAIGLTPSNVIISFYFVPDQCQNYQDTVKILTNMPLYSFEVNVMGKGSRNEKFCIEGL